MHPNAKRLFALVTLAFLVIIAGWVILVIVAQRNKPEPIPLPPPNHAQP